jgi:hypothetical protein
LGYKEKKIGNKAKLLKLQTKQTKGKNKLSAGTKPTQVIQAPSGAQPQITIKR